MVRILSDLRDAHWFQNFITLAILSAGVLVGASTYPGVVSSWGQTMATLDTLILMIFIAEIVVKMGAEGRRPWRYFLDPWNCFDFLIVAICLVPGMGQYGLVLRLARLLRVLKLVTAIPKLQLLVGALLKSIPSMFYVSLLLLLLFYLYAVAAVFMFGANDPIHFGNLQISLLSLFRAVTLEDWTDLMYIQMYGCENYGYGGNEALCTNSQAMPVGAALFFVSFVLMGTMVVLNLFIGVIMNGMDEASADLKKLETDSRPGSMDAELASLSSAVVAIQHHIERLERMAKDESRPNVHAVDSSA